MSTTPRPDAAQAAAPDAAMAAIYPGVPEGKTADWWTSTCQEIVAGKDDATLASNTALRFAGGTRPNPTPEQATAILAAISASGFCD